MSIKKASLLLLALLTLSLSSCGNYTVVDVSANGEEISSTVITPSKPSNIDDCGISFNYETIRISTVDNEKYLFLPSAFVGGALALCDGADVSVADKKWGHGDVVTFSDISDGFTLNFDDDKFDVKVMRSANIPALFLNSSDGSFDKINNSYRHEYKTNGDISLYDSMGERLYSEKIKEIKGRGNSTWGTAEKKPYQIELFEKESLLGLAESEKYILLANYFDPSLLRNSTAFDIAALASDDYSPSYKTVDLYCQGRYNGTYLLCEKIDIEESKINIENLEQSTKLLYPDYKLRDFSQMGESKPVADSMKWYDIPENPSDITGGYLLEVDYPERYEEEGSGFLSGLGMPVVLKSPQYASYEQVKYIKDFIDEFEDALYSPDGVGENGRHYTEYIDLESLAFRYLLEEFALNIDGGIASFHFYKDSEKNGGKLYFSCVWDYDCTFGNSKKYADLTSPEILFVAESERRNNGSMPSWFYQAMQHEDFRTEVKKVYDEKFSSAIRTVLEELPYMKDEISASASMDYALYPNAQKRLLFCEESGKDFDEAYDYFYNFYSKRVTFFEKTFG